MFVEAICDSCCSRFIDDSENFKAGNLASVFGGLSLRIIEVGRHRDDCFVNLLAQKVLCYTLHFRQNHRRNFFRVKFFLFALVVDNNQRLLIWSFYYLEWPVLNVLLHLGIVELAANQSFSVKYSVFIVPRCLIFSCITDQSFFFCKCNIGWSCILSLVVRDDFNFIIEPYSNAGVGCT